jgi:arabinofuranan 3-O-arabinosyltransferase
VDSLAPALSRRPVAERSFTPYADLRATDLHWTVDALVQQRRLLPGQLPPLLALLGVRSVITPADDDPARGGGPYPADVEAQLSKQPGLSRPDRSYGPLRPAAHGPDELGASVALPQVRRYDLPSARPLVRVEPRARPLVVDGSADTLVAASSFGMLPARRPVRYAADLPTPELRRLASRGAELVMGDSNRRRAFVSASLVQNAGATLPSDQAPAENGVILDPFSDGAPAQTVAVLHGARSIDAPFSPTIPQFPEHRPFAAFDGDPQTAWLADRTLDSGRWRLDLAFTRPRDVPYVDIVPYSDSRGTVREVEIADKRFAVRRGVNRIDLGLRDVGGLSVRLADVERPQSGVRGAGGIAELRVPGLRLSEELSLPRVSARSLAGLGLERSSLSYIFTRTTGDDPHRRQLAHGPWSARDVRDRGDAERELRRVFTLPATRSFRADAWVTVAADTPDDEIDTLAGYRGPVRADSSSRYQARPAWRASSALDHDPASAWIGGWVRGERAWIRWSTPRAQTVGALRLAAAREDVRRPTLVRLRWAGGRTSPKLRVGPGGEVVLPGPVRSRSFELEVLEAAFAPDVPAGRRRNRGVGIAEIEGVDGLRAVRGAGRDLSARCGALNARVGAKTVDLRVSAPRSDLEAGKPLRARHCGPPVRLGAGERRLSTSSGEFAIDSLRLSSSAPAPASAPPGEGGRVVAGGTPGRGRLDDVRLRVNGPSWLVLGEGYNRGWRAWCGDRSLGAPEPVDGYANGWRVGPGCRSARFAFAPNGSARLGYAVSLLASLACLALVAVDPRRRPRPAVVADAGELPGADAPERWTLRNAGAAALVCGLIIAFLFGPVPGAVALVPIFLALRAAVGARALALAGGALLALVVPLLYLVHPADSDRANNVRFAAERIAAHWVTVAALILLFGALLRTLAAARGDRTGPGRLTAMLARARGPERLHASGDPSTHGAGRRASRRPPGGG